MPSTFRYRRAHSGQNKYNASKVEVDGVVFDSKAEAAHYQALKIFEKEGLISSLKLQPKFQFMKDGEYLKTRTGRYPAGRRVSYIADFSFVYKGKRVVQDTKGMDTDMSRIKRALVELFHGIHVQVVRHAGELPE